MTVSRSSAQVAPVCLIQRSETGLRLFEDITYLDEYYLTNAEIEVLTTYSKDLAKQLPPRARLVELGSGNLRKVSILLDAFEEAKKPIEYFALDLSHPELERTLAAISPGTYRYVKCSGLYGTYDDGLSWLESTKSSASATCVMSLGSSVGNFSRKDAAAFLRDFAVVLGSEDYMMIAVDACQDVDRVHAAYNDKKGVTERFYRNGLTHTNSLLGYEAFKQEDWEVVGSYNASENHHQARFVARNDVQIGQISIPRGTNVELERAFKYNNREKAMLWHEAGLIHQRAYTNRKGDYGIHLLSPAFKGFDLHLEKYVKTPIPGLAEWIELWSAWDTVTRCMTPEEELASKPISLRNDLIFYLGHIPAFCDLHLSKATGQTLSPPASFIDIFERGIDPDVENPEHCHEHSKIPDSWPPLADILEYQSHVRERVRSILASGQVDSNQRVARAVWLTFEHEAMHLETYLYMLLQSNKVKPPPGVTMPDFEALANAAKQNAQPNQWFTIPEARITLGIDDAEDDLETKRYFGWDNEKPAREVDVHSFEVQARPITNGEYAEYLRKTSSKALPVSWVLGDTPSANGSTPGSTKSDPSQFVASTSIRTVFGPIPLPHALHWPVMASYDELAGYATWAGGRIPTLEEARSIYHHADGMRARETAQKVPSSLISAVNGCVAFFILA